MMEGQTIQTTPLTQDLYRVFLLAKVLLVEVCSMLYLQVALIVV